MATISIMGDASGAIDLTVPAAAGSHVLTLPMVTGTLMASATPLTFPAGSGTSGQVLTTDGAGNLSWSTVSGTGTVTSVVSNLSGVTVTNASTTPTLDGTLDYANGGTGLSALGSPGQILAVNPGGTAITWVNASSGGSVTSVTYTGDNVVYQTGPTAAVTNSGTLQPALKTQTANTFLAGPQTGVAAAPTFRAIGYNDLNASFNANQSQSANGHQTLPGGVIIQWGVANTGGGTVTITLPTTPAAGFSVTATPHDGAGTNAVLTINKISSTQFSVNSVTGSTGTALGSVDFDWVAICY